MGILALIGCKKGAMIGFDMPVLLRSSMHYVPVQRCDVCRCDGEIMKECRRDSALLM